MTSYPHAANTDANGKVTTAVHGDRGDGVSEWFGYVADAMLRAAIDALSHAEDTAHVTADQGMMNLGVRNDTLVARAGTNGDYSPVALGQGGEQFVTPSVSAAVENSAPTNAETTAYTASLIVKASAGTLFGFTVHNSLASVQFLQLYNAASLPANGAVPAIIWAMPASTTIQVDFGVYGRYCSTGIVLGNSSTGPTKTIGSADLWISARYK